MRQYIITQFQSNRIAKQHYYLVRNILYKYVPRKLIERPKQGFGIPVGLWLRGPLREWAEELLTEPKIRDGGFFALN